GNASVLAKAHRSPAESLLSSSPTAHASARVRACSRSILLATAPCHTAHARAAASTARPAARAHRAPRTSAIAPAAEVTASSPYAGRRNRGARPPTKRTYSPAAATPDAVATINGAVRIARTATRVSATRPAHHSAPATGIPPWAGPSGGTSVS